MKITHLILFSLMAHASECEMKRPPISAELRPPVYRILTHRAILSPIFVKLMVLCFGLSASIKMTPLILLLVVVSGVYSDDHSLRYYLTGVSSPGLGLPVYSSVGYVDDQEITNYNSDTRQYLPKTEWMKKLEPEYWDGQTQIGRGNEAVSKHNVQIAMKRFNHTTGIHIVQRMSGCVLKDDGNTEGSYQHRYDGGEFLYLDTKDWRWIPTMNEAQITADRWNSERLGERYKNYLQNICIDWLKKYVNNGREDLERRVRPEVKVWGRHHSDGSTRLQCLAYGFHPRPVDVRWMKNGVDHVLSDEMSPTLPHPDGTYQIRVSVEVPTNEEDSYACYVEHSSLRNETLIVIWDSNFNGPSVGAIVGGVLGSIALVLIIIIIIIAVVFWRRKNKNDYQSTNTSDTTSDSSKEVTA